MGVSSTANGKERVKGIQGKPRKYLRALVAPSYGRSVLVVRSNLEGSRRSLRKVQIGVVGSIFHENTKEL